MRSPNGDFMQTFVTVLTRADGRAAGKTFDARGKHVANHTGQYHAHTVTLTGTTSADLLTAYADLVGSLSVSQLVILGHAPALPTEYEIRPAKSLPGDGTGIYFVDGRPTIARLKQHFEPSRILMLDFDPDERMPESWHALDAAGRWDLLTAALPEFAYAARLTIPSGSARVLTADGQHVKSGPLGSHTYIVTDRDLSTADLDEARTALEIRLWAAGLGYVKPSKSGAALKRSIVDSAVWTAGREVFDGPPCVRAPYRLVDLSSAIFDGGMVAIVTDITDADAQGFEAACPGARVIRAKDDTGTPGGEHHGGSVKSQTQIRTRAARIAIEDHVTLKLGTTVVTEKGPLTIRQFLDGPHDRVRCQTPFRESSSWAGILRRSKQGAMLHDVGTGITYRLGADEADLSGSLAKDLAKLEAYHPIQAQATARALLWRHSWRCPWAMSFAALVASCVTANAAVDADDLHALASAIEAKARRDAERHVTIEADKLPSNVRVHRVGSIEAARRGIEAAGGGVHLCKAPHAAGKTQMLLRPIALASNGVTAIAPRVSLVSDLATRLDLGHYQTTATDPDLGICVNSIINPKYSLLDGSHVVLVDEIARVIRECHTPKSTMGKDARRVWDKLTGMMRAADLAVGVDADLSTADVTMLAAAVGTQMHVWVVDEDKRDKHAAFVSDEQIMIEIETAIADGHRCLIVADSANRLAGLADELAGRFPTRRIFAVHNKRGLATTGTLEAKALLSDINAECTQYDVLLLSPAVESGVSLNVEHFDKHFGLYGGTVEPSAFNQQLLRDRTAIEWRIAITGTGRASRLGTYAEVLSGLHASIRRVRALDGDRGEIAAASPFDHDVCRTTAAANAARNQYGQQIWLLLEARGWTVKHGPSGKPKAGADLRVDAKDAARIKQTTAIAQVSDRPARDIDALRDAYIVTPEESAIIARADVRDALGLPSGEITPDHVDVWQDGKLESQNALFEAATAARITPSARDESDDVGHVSFALRSFDAPRAEAAKALFAALGLDPETGEGEVTDASARAAYLSLKDTEQGRVLSHFGIARFAGGVPAYPVRWANDVIRRFGLWLQGRATGADGSGGRVYTISLDEQRDRRGRFKLPGLRLMLEIRKRRLALRLHGTWAHDTALQRPQMTHALIDTLKPDVSSSS